MDKATVVQNCADELSEFGDYDVSSDSLYLPRMMFKAMRDIYSRHQWTFKKASTSITTTSGNRGGYSLPTDFSGFVRAENNSKVYEKDSVTFARCLDADGREMEIYLRRDENKVYFVQDPGDNVYSLNYVPALVDIDSMASWPDDLCQILIEFTKSNALMNSENTVNMATIFKNNAENMLSRYWDDERKKQIISNGKKPIGAYGVSVAECVRYGMGR